MPRRRTERVRLPLRRSARFGIAFVAFGFFCAAFLTPRPVLAGPFEVNDATWEGGSELYEIAKTELGPERVKPVATLDWSTLKADDAVLVLHPTQPIDAGEASDFMKQGGRLAIVDDFGRGDEILHRFKIERVPMPLRPVGMLRQNAELPIHGWTPSIPGARRTPSSRT